MRAYLHLEYKVDHCDSRGSYHLEGQVRQLAQIHYKAEFENKVMKKYVKIPGF